MPLDKNVQEQIDSLQSRLSVVVPSAEKINVGKTSEENTKKAEIVAVEVGQAEKTTYQKLDLDLAFSDGVMEHSKVDIDEVRKLVKELIPFSEKPDEKNPMIQQKATIHNCRHKGLKPLPCDGEKDL
jgi:hypothetical protein